MTPERWRQIEELYHSVRERAKADQAALLGQADLELRREVEALLVQDASGGKILDEPAEDLLTDSRSPLVAAGSQLGPYQIEALLGAGGMGQVFQAVDTRLGRKVAIKISTEQFSERFEREARAISALNHPHICTLYDVGPNYLVMELVEGETLSAKLNKRKLSIEDTLRYGGQIADALAEAHSKGITHRDLKPGNIMVTKSGVKVLDFGLAKSPHDDTLTVTNAVMGTPAYMAPEQREGKQCDARTDIYALGLVVREMATGHRDGVKPDLPVHLAHVIGRCLAVEPESRWQSARDVKGELEWIAVQPVHTPQQDFSPTLRKVPWAVAVVVVLVAAVGWWLATRSAPLRPLMSLNLDLADETPLASGFDAGGNGGGKFDLSPDGARLALTLRGADGKVRLYTRLLDQNQITPLTGTENASSPFFSPDGKWIGFFADGKLKKISVGGGGAAVVLCDALYPRGASWGDDGNIIAALTGFGELSRIPSSGGGMPVPVTHLNPGEVFHRWPQVLPGSQAVLFTVNTQAGGNFDNATIDVVSLKTGVRKTVQRGGFFARYLTTSNGGGHLIYLLHQNTLFAAPFDPGRLALAGVPAPVLEGVSSNVISGGDFAFAEAPLGRATFVYLAGKGQAVWPISWLDSAGKSQPLQAPPGVYRTPRFSPDGKRLAFSISGSQGEDIWVKDLDRGTSSRLSFVPGGLNRWPVWTPDGKNIVFLSGNPAAPGLYWIRSDGSGEARRLTEGKLSEYLSAYPYSFSPDGKRLAFYRTGNGGIFTAPVEGDPGQVHLGKPELFLGTPSFAQQFPAFSPDGRWLAYSSNESGTFEVYVRPFPGPGELWKISEAGGTLPVWSRDGELLFETLDRRVMAVSYSAKGDSFIAEKPRVWSEPRLQDIFGSNSNYDLAPDGKRLAAFLASDQASTHLTVLLNFFDELRRRAPAGKPERP